VRLALTSERGDWPAPALPGGGSTGRRGEGEILCRRPPPVHDSGGGGEGKRRAERKTARQVLAKEG